MFETLLRFFIPWINVLKPKFHRLPEKIGGSLRGVHYIRDVADADQLVAALVSLCNCFMKIYNISFEKKSECYEIQS